MSIGKCNKFFNELMRKRMNRVFFSFFSIDNVRLVRLALTTQSDDRFFSRNRGYQIHDFFPSFTINLADSYWLCLHFQKANSDKTVKTMAQDTEKR